jgi:hypothetical protein
MAATAITCAHCGRVRAEQLDDTLLYIKIHGAEYIAEGKLQRFRCRDCRKWTRLVDDSSKER